MNNFIEPKIKPLVEALNSWEGIKTYSSCEGHGGMVPEERNQEPHVTFTCNSEESLIEILNKLKETSWKIILNDWAATEDDIHYTLRYAPIGFYAELEDLEKTQGEISKISELLHKESSKSASIKNNFPVLKCKACGEEQFTIDGILDFDLGYHYSGRFPQLKVNRSLDINFSCSECYEQLELEDPLSEFIDLLNRGSFE